MLNYIVSTIKTIGSVLIVGFVAIAGVSLVIYTFMILEELIAWII